MFPGAGRVRNLRVSGFLEWPKDLARPGIARRSGMTFRSSVIRVIVHPHHAFPLEQGKSYKLLKKWRQKNFLQSQHFSLDAVLRLSQDEI